MASSPPHYSLTSKLLESLSTKKSAPRGDLDDTRSSTSMSSNTKVSVCRICKGPERHVSPLIACIVCKSRYHRSCPNPSIEKQLAEYTCSRCVEKRAKQANTTIMSNHSRMVGTQDHAKIHESNAAQETMRLETAVGAQSTIDRVSPPQRSVSIILCQGKDNDGKDCLRPAQSGKADNLCFMCALMSRHKKAKESPMPPPVAAPRPPINKKKLHNLRKEDRPLVTKRKRASSGTGYASRTTKYEIIPASRSPKTVTDPDKKTPFISSNLLIQDSSSTVGRSEPASLQPSLTQGAGALGVWNHTIPAKVKAWDERLKTTTVPKVVPEHSALPELEKMQLAADEAPEETPEIANDALDNGIAYPDKPSQDSESDELKEGRKKDTSSISMQNRTPFDNSSPEPPSPMSDASSYNLPSPKFPNFEALEQRDDVSMKSATDEASFTSYVKLNTRAREFDESILDSFLLQQSERDTTYEPTSNELLDTQNWSAGDPRPFWPTRLTATQKAEKMIEIEARGGRKAKANFGNVLRPQLVQERKARGWDAHQSREKGDDPEALEAVQKLGELFGVPEGELGNYVPRTVDGKLVMLKGRESQPKRPGPGRQKKEAPLGMYPVRGGQL